MFRKLTTTIDSSMRRKMKEDSDYRFQAQKVIRSALHLTDLVIQEGFGTGKGSTLFPIKDGMGCFDYPLRDAIRDASRVEVLIKHNRKNNLFYWGLNIFECRKKEPSVQIAASFDMHGIRQGIGAIRTTPCGQEKPLIVRIKEFEHKKP